MSLESGLAGAGAAFAISTALEAIVFSNNQGAVALLACFGGLSFFGAAILSKQRN